MALPQEREITIGIAEDELEWHVFCAHKGYRAKLDKIVSAGAGRIVREDHGGTSYRIDKRAVSIRIPTRISEAERLNRASRIKSNRQKSIA